MLYICPVCERALGCQSEEFPILCCECPADDYRDKTGQICQSISSDEEIHAIICPTCQFKILWTNIGGFNG